MWGVGKSTSERLEGREKKGPARDHTRDERRKKRHVGQRLCPMLWKLCGLGIRFVLLVDLLAQQAKKMADQAATLSLLR